MHVADRIRVAALAGNLAWLRSLVGFAYDIADPGDGALDALTPRV
jgi:hypothetical protein